MSDIGFALEAKSDQLNYDDIADTEVVITISEVQVRKGDQPVSIYFHGCNNRPWKPSKGMLRILATAWGRSSSEWVSKSAMLYGDKSVRWAGKEIGGIRIRSLSHINKNGISAMLTVSRGQRSEFRIGFLCMERPVYPQDRFDATLAAMVEMISTGKKSIEQVVARCQATGDLTAQQLSVLESAIPVTVNEGDE
jgi:hypothetical protein